MKRLLLLVFCVALPLALAASAAAAPLKVVTSLAAYGAIAEAVGGDRVEVASISRGDEDAHFVKPKPSFALMLKSADLFVTTGLDLELWVPVLLDKSGNRKVREGQPGYVNASRGVPLLDVPTSADRSAGDVHVYGNPHIFTSPLNAKIIAGNVADGLKRVDPAGAAVYEANLAAFRRAIDVRLYGEELLAVLGSDVLDTLARDGRLVAFLEAQRLAGRPLVERLGGWLAEGAVFRGRKIVTYHKNWIYFTELFGLEVVGFVEPKPGIPPAARHVHELIETIKAQRVGALLAASYFSAQQVQNIAERTGCTAIRVPLGPGGEGPADYFALVDLWVGGLRDAFAPPTAAG